MKVENRLITRGQHKAVKEDEICTLLVNPKLKIIEVMDKDIEFTQLSALNEIKKEESKSVVKKKKISSQKKNIVLNKRQQKSLLKDLEKKENTTKSNSLHGGEPADPDGSINDLENNQE